MTAEGRILHERVHTAGKESRRRLRVEYDEPIRSLHLGVVSLSFLTEHGRFLARFQGPVSGNVLLRREQYRRADDLHFSVQVAYQKRKQEEMTHPFLDEKMSLGLFFHTQALLFASYLRGELDGYPPVIWK